MTLMMMRKCNVRRGSIDENKDNVSHGIVAFVKFSDAADLAKWYGSPTYKQGMRYSRSQTFHIVYDFWQLP